MAKISDRQAKLSKLTHLIAPVGDDIPTAVKEIPQKLVIEPNMPVGVFLLEAFNIHFFAQNDREKLLEKGLNWELMEELPRRMEYLRQCDAVWWRARFGDTENEHELRRVKEMADSLQEELMQALDRLAHGDESIRKVVQYVKNESDYNNRLWVIAEVCVREWETLKDIGCKPSWLEDIKYCKEKYMYLVKLIELEKIEAAGTQRARNKAYTFLLVALEEIRRCAEHAFHHDKKHLKGYQSDYFRRRPK